jgi:hypothetical protein
MAAPKIEVSEDSGYKTIVVNGLFGGMRPGYFELIVFTDELAGKDALGTINLAPERAYIKRTIHARLVMDPVTAKSIGQWFEQHIEEYEKTFGKIPSMEDRVIRP